MSSLAEERRYNYGEYKRLGNIMRRARYEMIDGTVYAMASPSRMHQKMSGEIFGQLWQFLKGKKCEVYNAPFDVRLFPVGSDDTIVQPDIFVVCDESKHDGKSIKGPPNFIIEILSESNTQYDTVVKFGLYQKAGVSEYWIVDPSRRTVEVYILRDGKYGVGSIYRGYDIVPVRALDGCEINLADVFGELNEADKIELEKALAKLRRTDLELEPEEEA